MHEGEIKCERRNHKGLRGNKCMRAKIKCETENKGLRIKRGTRAKEENEKFRGEMRGAENAQGKIKCMRW